MYCAKCGAEMQGNEKFCGVCGEPVEKNVTGSSQTKPKNKGPIIAVVIVGVILAVVVGIVGGTAVFRHFNKEEIVEEYAYIPEEFDEEVEELTEDIEDEQEDAAEEKTEVPVQPKQSGGTDVESEVKEIREIYNHTVENIDNNMYEKVQVSEGIVAYYNGEIPVAVVISAGVYGNPYSRSYYYDSQELIFAYY